MKVLDLQCQNQHVFEGWFASEGDFLDQNRQSLIECPFCGSAAIDKKLTAPRLNLGAPEGRIQQDGEVLSMPKEEGALQQAWMAVARQVLARTDDVGERFPEEARKIHYGEVKARGIRGQASAAEADALIDEGISVVALPLPNTLKRTLQ